MTYSADGSIKFWNLDESISMLPPISGAKDDDAGLHMLSREILKVLYVDENCKSWIQAPDNQGKCIFQAPALEYVLTDFSNIQITWYRRNGARLQHSSIGMWDPHCQNQLGWPLSGIRGQRRKFEVGFVARRSHVN